MGLRISSNIASQVVQKNVSENTQKMEHEFEKLSSGKRITKAADDAAGLAIGTRLEATTRGLRQATRNAGDGVSVVQTAEGGLSEVMNILVRMRELTIQSASDTVGDTEREMLNKEYQQLTSEIDRISESTNLQGVNLLSGDNARDEMKIQVGAYKGDENVITFDTSKISASTGSIGVSGTGVVTKDDALDSIQSIDEAIDNVSGMRAELGSVQSRLNSSIANLETQTVNQDAARSQIMDVDVAESAAKLASSNVIKNAGVSTLAQANAAPNVAMKLIG